MFVGHIGVIAASRDESLSYTFWTISNNTGVVLNDVTVTFSPPTDTVQINWGDGSVPETINTGTSYSHAFN
jgi:hypothetical protein